MVTQDTLTIQHAHRERNGWAFTSCWYVYWWNKKEWFNYCIHLNDHHQNHSKEQFNGTQTESGLTFKWLWCSIYSYRKRQSQWAKCKLSAWLYDVTWVMEEFLRRKIDGYREKGDKTSNVLILVRLDFLAFFGV